MENPEEILHSLEEFSKLRPKNIPRELEDYLCFVAKTGDPVYQWSVIKCLFREKLINVITEFYESCPSVEIPPCRNVDIFNYDMMKSFILEKLDTFVAAPFTVQRICELLTTPRKEYNRIDKYMRALEKNILVVSTTEPGNHRTPENGEGFINGIESDHVQDGSHDINIEEMDDAPVWPPKNDSYQSTSKEEQPMLESAYNSSRDNNEPEAASSQANLETVICSPSEEPSFIPVSVTSHDTSENSVVTEEKSEIDVQEGNEECTESVPAVVQRRRTSIEPPFDETETPAITHHEEEIINPVEMDGEKQPEIVLETEQSQPQETTQIAPVIEELSEEVHVEVHEEPKVETTTVAEPSENINITDLPGSTVDDLNITTETEIQNKNEVTQEEIVKQTKEVDVTSLIQVVPEDVPAILEIPKEPNFEEVSSSIQEPLEGEPFQLEVPVDVTPLQESVDDNLPSDTSTALNVPADNEKSEISSSSEELVEENPTESISMEQKALEQAPEVSEPEPDSVTESEALLTEAPLETPTDTPMDVDVCNDMDTTTAEAEATTVDVTPTETTVAADSNN